MSGFFAIFTEHAIDLFRIIADQVVDLDGLDYAGFPPGDEGLDGDAEEVSSFFLREEIGLEVHVIKFSKGIPVFFETSRALFFPSVRFLLRRYERYETDIPKDSAKFSLFRLFFSIYSWRAVGFEFLFVDSICDIA